MIPAEFDYVAPESLDAALDALRGGGEDAKVLAGGHSLLPLMKLRLAAPSLLVDLRKVPGLSGIERENGSFRIGAMTRHHAVATSDLGLAATVAATIADPQVRNRGTIGGSIAHGDPASDMPAVRAIVRNAARNEYRFSSLVAGVVHSQPFQMRTVDRPRASAAR